MFVNAGLIRTGIFKDNTCFLRSLPGPFFNKPPVLIIQFLRHKHKVIAVILKLAGFLGNMMGNYFISIENCHRTADDKKEA
ncbi:Uncharacterised protein [Mycobacteroides abscessus subsp. abscessus]|nr:Uncharacterised protein [Mycobacteroides abscessus subsp. abscessus]